MKRLRRRLDIFHFCVIGGSLFIGTVLIYAIITGDIKKNPMEVYLFLLVFSIIYFSVGHESLMLRLSYDNEMVELRAGAGYFLKVEHYRVPYEDIGHLDLCLPRSFKDAFSIAQSNYQIVIQDKNVTKPIDYIGFPPGQIRIVFSRFVAESSIDFLETLARARPDLQTKIDTMIEEILANRMVINWKRY
jgi:hypothetical protein